MSRNSKLFGPSLELARQSLRLADTRINAMGDSLIACVNGELPIVCNIRLPGIPNVVGARDSWSNRLSKRFREEHSRGCSVHSERNKARHGDEEGESLQHVCILPLDSFKKYSMSFYVVVQMISLKEQWLISRTESG